MDQQYFYQPTVIKNAAYYRERARNALKGWYWYALLASFIASIFGGVSAGAFNFNFNTSTEMSKEQTNAFMVQIKDILSAIRGGDFSNVFEVYPWLAVLGVVFAVAVVLSYCKKSLIVVALSSSATVLLVEWLPTIL